MKFTADGNCVLEDGGIAYDWLENEEESKDLADALNEAAECGLKFAETWEGFIRWAEIMEHPILKKYDYRN